MCAHLKGPNNFFGTLVPRPRGWTLKTRSSPAGVTATNLVVLGETVSAWIRRSSRKVWPFASCLSRSLKVIGAVTGRSAAYHFRVAFHSNCGHISYIFRDKERCFPNFSTSRVFNALLRGFPWNFVTAIVLKNQKDAPTKMSKMWYVHSYGYSTGIGQTERRNW